MVKCEYSKTKSYSLSPCSEPEDKITRQDEARTLFKPVEQWGDILTRDLTEFLSHRDYPLQYSWASLVAQTVKNLPAL